MNLSCYVLSKRRAIKCADLDQVICATFHGAQIPNWDFSGDARVWVGGDASEDSFRLARPGKQIPKLAAPIVDLVLCQELADALSGIKGIVHSPVEFAFLADCDFNEAPRLIRSIPEFSPVAFDEHPEQFIRKLPELTDRRSVQNHYRVVGPTRSEIFAVRQPELLLSLFRSRDPLAGLTSQLLDEVAVIYTEFGTVMRGDVFNKIADTISGRFFEFTGPHFLED